MYDDKDIESVFCRWASTLTFADLKPSTVDKVLELVADTVGCAVGGVSAPTAEAARRFSGPSARDGVSVVGLGERFSVADAARHMSIACHVLEMDDIVPSGSVHPGAVVIPAAIAVGEMLDVTGEQLITSIAIGYELMVRLGEAVDPVTHYNDGFHPTATCGVFGAAAAVASLLGAGADEFRTALGAAACSVAGTLAYLNDGAATKPIQVGNAASDGVLAALLNHEGVRGSTTVFGGRYGFFHSYAPAADPSQLIRSLGTGQLRVEQSGIKPFACCRYVQPGIGLLIDLCVAHDIVFDQVDQITVGVVAPTQQIVGEPRDRKVRPSTAVDIQFSLPYSAAIAVALRQLMPDDVAGALDNEQLSEFASRVHLAHDPQLDVEYPEKWGGWVNVTLRDGTVYRASTVEPKGDPANPLTPSELHDKLVALVGHRRGDAIERATGSLVNGRVRDFVATIEASL